MAGQAGKEIVRSLFTPERSEELRPLVRKTLISAFNVMFNLDPSLSASCGKGKGPEVRAHIELKSGKGKSAFLNVVVTSEIIDKLCEMLGCEKDEDRDKMGQEIACEVANIIGHAIRTYFIENTKATIDVGLPKPGARERAPSDIVALSLQALGKTNDAASIDFVFSKT